MTKFREEITGICKNIKIGVKLGENRKSGSPSDPAPCLIRKET
jgi:hypothetical protein